MSVVEVLQVKVFACFVGVAVSAIIIIGTYIWNKAGTSSGVKK